MDHILDEETKKALQGYLPFSCKCSTEFTPDLMLGSQIPSELLPKFKVRPLTKDEKTQIDAVYKNLPKKAEDMLSQDWSEIGMKLVPIFRACLIGWRDFIDLGDGGEIEFKPETAGGGCSQESWDTIPSWMHDPIRFFIRKISCLTPVEALSLKSSQQSDKESLPSAAKSA
jgi:hypothetical protein